jgi:hemoglobin
MTAFSTLNQRTQSHPNMENLQPVPTPYQWAGGIEAFEKLTSIFYDKVLKDEILEPVFRHMSPEHSRHVAAFLSECFKGPAFYSEKVAPENPMIHMVGKHLSRHLTETQRQRWMQLILQSADEIGMPADPEFRSVLVGHLEWGTRLAVQFSAGDENPMTAEDHTPKWGWGEVGGPYGFVEPIFRKKDPDK